MLSYLLKNPIFGKFKVGLFTKDDYKTMCMLIKYKFPIYNESIVLNKQVKLLDQQGRLVGKYEASQARKKANNLNKDIVLFNKQSTPAICKLSDFRTTVIQNFYDEVVVKRNESILRKVSQIKSMKINLNATQNQLKIKTKQLIELSKKNLKLRIFIRCKNANLDEGLSKLQFLKSQIQNACFIDEDISYREDEEDEENKNKMKTIAMTIKSKKNQFMELLNQTKADSPEETIQTFLKRYRKQEDIEMMDLKLREELIEQRLMQNEDLEIEKMNKKLEKQEVAKLLDQKQIQKEERERKFQDLRQVRAQILKSRIEKMLRI